VDILNFVIRDKFEKQFFEQLIFLVVRVLLSISISTILLYLDCSLIKLIVF